MGEIFEEYSEKNRADLPPLTIIQGGGTVYRDESNRNLQFDKNSLSNYKAVNPDDFIVHLRSFEGGLEKATYCGLISPAYHTFHGDGIDSDFYYLYFRSKRFIDTDLKPHVYGIRDGRSIDIDGMKTIPIPWTTVNEQRAIGGFYNSLDSFITLHQRKCQYRGLYGCLSWEQRKFSDVAVIRRGLTYSPTNIVDGADGVRVLRSSNINENHFVLNDDDVFVDESAVNIDLVHDGDILITAANGSPRLVGKRARISDLPGKTVHGGFMLVASSPCSDFLCASMGSSWYRRFLATGVAGGNGAIGNLDSKALGETIIAVPNDAEIDKLGNFFTRLDSLITLHQ